MDTQTAETMTPLLDVIAGADALAVIPRAELIFVPGGAQKILANIKTKARADAAKLDVSRSADRKAMRSLAWDLRRLKTTGDESGKALKADYLAKINPIDAERRVWREDMDELIAEIIAPAEKYDAEQAAEVLAHETAIAELKAIGDQAPSLSSAEITVLIDKLAHTHPVRAWQEFETRATETRRNAHNALVVEMGIAIAREEAEAKAEAERLAAEEAARQEAARLQAEREAEIARQAAETARLAAEAAAAEEAARVAREAEEARLAAERAAQAERERIEAEAREAAAAAEAERLRIIREAEEAERAAAAALVREQERAAQAERDRLAAQEHARQAAAQAERDRVAAEERAERRRLAAIEAERARVEGERIRQEAETRRREEDQNHQRKINREVVADLVAAGLLEDAAVKAMKALTKGEVRHARIAY